MTQASPASPAASNDATRATDALLQPDGSSARGPLNDDVVVRCSGLSKTFRDFWLRNRVRAVDNIDLDIRRGEVFGLLGPNGSGKSTTIKMILGLLHPTAGRISVFGKRPEDVTTKKLIGYLPEESYLYRFLNARETLEYYGKLFHQSRAQSQKRIDMLLEMVGLESAQRRPIGEYSKGMQRRIGLAQALINDPQLLILDEPTTGLDPIGTKQIKDLIVELAQRGKTILLCSHLLSDVEDVCDRVSIMFGGKVRAQGTCDELLIQHSATTIQTEALDDKVVQEIEEVLARHGKSIDQVTHPRQKLEDLFLEIVHRAQTEGADTSGARAGGRIPSFLMEEEEQRGSHLPEEVQASALVQKLVASGAKDTADSESDAIAQKAKEAQVVAQEASRKATEQQQSVLDSLVKPEDKPQPQAPDKSQAQAPQKGQGGPAKPVATKPALSAPPSDHDHGLINDLLAQGTAATPERTETPAVPTKAEPKTEAKAESKSEPESKPQPKPESRPESQIQSSSGEPSSPKPPASPFWVEGASEDKTKSESESATGSNSGLDAGEAPDVTFKEEVKKVPPYNDPRQNKGSS